MGVITIVNGKLASRPFTAVERAQIWNATSPNWQADYLTAKNWHQYNEWLYWADRGFKALAGTSFVYFLVRNDLETFKIGKTNNLPARIAQMGIESQLCREWCSFCQVPRAEAVLIEKSLHRLYRPYNVPMPDDKQGSTEWFCTSIISEASDHVMELLRVRDMPQQWEQLY